VLFDESDEAQARPEVVEYEETKPLAEELIDTLIDLLFFSDFTVPGQPQGKPKVSYAIWQSGVGCAATIPTTKEHESNRCEILRLLLTLTSQSMYMSPSMLPQTGTRALTHICTCPDKQVVLSVLCSLLNTVSQVNPFEPTVYITGWAVLTSPRRSSTTLPVGEYLITPLCSRIPSKSL